MRRALAACAALALVTALAGASTVAANAATQRPLTAQDDFPEYGVLVMNTAYNENLCLDAETDSGANPTQNGDKVQLWTCNGGSQQQWIEVQLANGAYEFYSNYPYSGLALGAEQDGGGLADQCGDPIQVQTVTGQHTYYHQQNWTTEMPYAQCY